MSAQTQSNTVTVKVRYFALLREEAGIEAETLTMAPGNLSDLYKHLQERYKFSLPLDAVRAAVDNRFCSWQTNLCQGAEIVFVPPVAGG